MGVISRRATVRGAITFTTWLDPNKSICQGITSIGSWPDAKSSALDIAPITPSILLSGLDTIAAYEGQSRLFRTYKCSRKSCLLTGICDEMGIPSCALQKRRHGVDIFLLITVAVTRGVRGAAGQRPAVVVGNVCCQATQRSGLGGIVVNLSVELSCWAQICRPTKPPSMSYSQGINHCPHSNPINTITHRHPGTSPRYPNSTGSQHNWYTQDRHHEHSHTLKPPYL